MNVPFTWIQYVLRRCPFHVGPRCRHKMSSQNVLSNCSPGFRGYLGPPAIQTRLHICPFVHVVLYKQFSHLTLRPHTSLHNNTHTHNHTSLYSNTHIDTHTSLHTNTHTHTHTSLPIILTLTITLHCTAILTLTLTLHCTLKLTLTFHTPCTTYCLEWTQYPALGPSKGVCSRLNF